MSSEELISKAMALPLAERVSLAQKLWESIESGLEETNEALALNDAIRRDEELSSGKIKGRTHEEVMRDARRSI